MGHRHSREDILAGAVAAAFAGGLTPLTFGVVAKHLGISDRIVVYYFPSKHDLVAEVLVAIGERLQVTLAPSLASADDHVEIVRRAWPSLASPDADPVFALYFEAIGLAAVGREPFASIVPQLVEAWIEWTASFVRGRPARRRAEAEAAIALIDGLLLLRHVAGPDAADRAARRLGIR